jgi:hypothetical protein
MEVSDQSHFIYCDMLILCQVTAVHTDDGTTAVARKQLCGHVGPPPTREHAITKEMYFVQSVPGLYED